jgi:hypothetical protein
MTKKFSGACISALRGGAGLFRDILSLLSRKKNLNRGGRGVTQRGEAATSQKRKKEETKEEETLGSRMITNRARRETNYTNEQSLLCHSREKPALDLIGGGNPFQNKELCRYVPENHNDNSRN